MSADMTDLSALTMTEIIRLQNQLQDELTRRFARQLSLVFSDIVGSTPYFARFGDAAGRQLQQLHFDLLGNCVSAVGGRIVDTAGDGAFCAFINPEAAVRALIELHQQIARSNANRGRQHQLQVRVGVHFGSVLTDGSVVSGDAVNLCSRVAASADPGEIRLTRDAFLELGRMHRLDCRSLGMVGLKGLAAPIELLALDWRDQAVFPRRLRIEETNEEIALPQQDIVAFGRLAEHEGQRANDVVLSHPDPESARQISRWHFELRRLAEGLQLKALSDNGTEVDGVILAKGEQTPVKAGSWIRLAEVLSLNLLGSPHASALEDSDSTTMYRSRR